MSEYDSRFGVAERDPEHFLGIRRKMSTDANGNRTLELTMPEYVSNLADEFREYLPADVPDTPWKPGLIIGMKEQKATIMRRHS
eukprot:SAG25_NODE_3878_length_939_cov_1.561905_1_plen_84_part_00